SVRRFWKSAFFSARVGGPFGALPSSFAVSASASLSAAGGAVCGNAPGDFRMRLFGTEAGGGTSEYCLTPLPSSQTYWASAAVQLPDNSSARVSRLSEFGCMEILEESRSDAISPCFGGDVNGGRKLGRICAGRAKAAAER